MNKAGVMGWPVSHSLSPRLHGFWLQTYSIEGSYEKLPVEPQNLATALRALQAQGLRGVNLTVPHKEAACTVVDEIDAVAKRIGAINLVTVGTDGKLSGRNTDAFGFTQNLVTSGFICRQGKALVLGAGGASRAVIVALIDMKFTEICITNRTLERAQKLAQEFSSSPCVVRAIAWQDTRQTLEEVELLVNATSLGMKGQPELIFSFDLLPKDATVTDIVYVPLETDLLRRARQKGHRAIDGLGMLLHQARPAFANFFGHDPEVTDELRKYVLEGLS